MCFDWLIGVSDEEERSQKPGHSPVTDAAVVVRQSFGSSDPRVLIIGAGVAGLACASKLIESGFQSVLIVEAEDRIGGRIQTLPFADNVVDLGAQWVHGEKGNIVYQMVRSKHLLDSTGNVYSKYQCIRSNGEVVPESIVDDLKDAIVTTLFGERESLSDFKGSMEEYLSKHFFRCLESDPKLAQIDHLVAIEFFENFKRMQSSETAAPISEVSAHSVKEYWQCEGDYFLDWKDKGFKQILSVLTSANELGNELGVLEGKILFGSMVDKIEWDQNNDSVMVHCQDIEPFEVDHVVVTVSLGVLKKTFDKMFVPRLPPEKCTAIENVGFGNLAKIYIEFEEPFWPDNWNGFATLWREQDSMLLRDTDDAWFEEVFGFFRVSYQPRVLLGWIVGSFANMVEEMDKAQLTNGCIYILRKFLPNWNIPSPLNLKISHWNSNEHFCGSYSFRSMDTDKNNTGALMLSQPLSILAIAPHHSPERNKKMQKANVPLSIKPVVLFAGEATSSHYFSTVHGAIETGYREAKRLTGYYSMDM